MICINDYTRISALKNSLLKRGNAYRKAINEGHPNDVDGLQTFLKEENISDYAYTMAQLVDVTSNTVCRPEEIVRGLVYGIRTQHQYCQQQFVWFLLEALAEYGKSNLGGENENAIKVCAEIGELFKDRLPIRNWEV